MTIININQFDIEDNLHRDSWRARRTHLESYYMVKNWGLGETKERFWFIFGDEWNVTEESAIHAVIKFGVDFSDFWTIFICQDTFHKFINGVKLLHNNLEKNYKICNWVEDLVIEDINLLYKLESDLLIYNLNLEKTDKTEIDIIHMRDKYTRHFNKLTNDKKNRYRKC